MTPAKTTTPRCDARERHGDSLLSTAPLLHTEFLGHLYGGGTVVGVAGQPFVLVAGVENAGVQAGRRHA